MLTTSGLGLGPSKIERLREFAQINVSYDGIGEDYESVRGYAYRSLGPTLTTIDAPPSTRGDCATVVGWHERALELSGANDVKVVETRCRNRGDTVCEYKLSWS